MKRALLDDSLWAVRQNDVQVGASGSAHANGSFMFNSDSDVVQADERSANEYDRAVRIQMR